MKAFKIYLKRISIIFIAIILILLSVYYINSRFKGDIESIKILSDVNLEGVFIKPKTKGPHPTVLLLHGAGSEHQSFNKLYFRFHANAFLKKGFAVLIYSKRSNKEVDYDYFTYEDLLNDAQAAINFLKERDDVNKDKIGIMGLSESGWFTPELASKNPEIKFIINRVSSPFNVTKTLSHEVRSDAMTSGYTINEIEHTILPLHKKIWGYYKNIHNKNIDWNGRERQLINRDLKRLNSDKHFSKWFRVSKLGEYDSTLYQSRAKRYLYDPMPYFKKIETPMLYVMAGKDKNIPTDEVLTFLNNEKNANGKDITIKLYENASHYLYKYGLDDGPYEGWMYFNDYLDTLTEWAKNKLNND